MNASLQSFAAVADKAAAEVEGVQEAWMDDMQHIVHVAEFVAEASDLALQRRLVYSLKMMLNNGTRPFINFLAESQPPNSLEPGPSVNKLWLEDGSSQQSAGSLPEPKVRSDATDALVKMGPAEAIALGEMGPPAREAASLSKALEDKAWSVCRLQFAVSVCWAGSPQHVSRFRGFLERFRASEWTLSTLSRKIQLIK